MFDLLFKSIQQKIVIADLQLKEIKPFFIHKRIRKKQYLLQEGNVCKYTAFVIKGILRSYAIDEKGVEHVIQFATEGWWISDSHSFLTGLPASYNIDAMEDAELLLITHDDMEKMLAAVPLMERYFRLLFQNNIIAIQSRLVCSLSQTAEEKYKKMNDDYPTLIQRVPQHTIASFLGITPETLSRIRKQLAVKD
jgi:CRP-like cAMP-binding protein